MTWKCNVDAPTKIISKGFFVVVTLHYYFWKTNTWCTLECVIFHNSQKLLLSVISHCFHQFLMIYFNKNTQTCERNTIKIDKREKIPDIFFDTLLFFTQKCSQERKQISYGDLNGKCFHHSEITRNTSHYFSTFSSGVFHGWCTAKNPVDFLFWVLYWSLKG